MTRRTSLCLCAALALGCASSPRATPAGARELTLTVVGTSDLHGRVEMLPWLGGHLRVLRAMREGAVLLVDAGDMFQGTIASNTDEGATVLAAYNALGYNAAAVGNHEFDYGPEGDANVAPHQGVHLVLIQRAIDHHMGDAGVQRCHQIQRLDDIRTVLTGQRHIGHEVQRPGERAHGLDRGGLDLGRVAARLQHREDERGELVAHRHAGEPDAARLAGAADAERGAPHVREGRILAEGQLGGEAPQGLEERPHLGPAVAGIQRRDELDGPRETLEVAGELILDAIIDTV